MNRVVAGGSAALRLDDILGERYAQDHIRYRDGGHTLRVVDRLTTGRLDLPPRIIFRTVLAQRGVNDANVNGNVTVPRNGLRRSALHTINIFIRLRAPVTFSTVSGRPISLLFTLLIPTSRAGARLRALSLITGHLTSGAVYHHLHTTRDSRRLCRVVASARNAPSRT